MMGMRLCYVSDMENMNMVQSKGIWGSTRNSLATWHVGDRLVFLIGREAAAVGRVEGDSYLDDEIIWKKDVFPFRVPVKVETVRAGKPGASVNAEIRAILMRAFGNHYGVRLQNSSVLASGMENSILRVLPER